MDITICLKGGRLQNSDSFRDENHLVNFDTVYFKTFIDVCLL